MEAINHEVSISKLTGSHFEIGKVLGEKTKQKYGPNYIEDSLAIIRDTSLYELLGMDFNLTPSYVDRVFPVLEQAIGSVHPLLLDELRGMAEGLGEDYRRLLVFTNNFGKAAGCTQFFTNGMLARNYDDAPNSTVNEFLLLKPENSLASFGAAAGYMDRLDGINEKGLAASLTYGAGHPAKEHGIGAATFIRIILDKAESVDEALEIFNKVPYVTPNNVMIADATGRAVVIESSGSGKYRVRNAHDKILVCANSYAHPEMADQQYIKNSTTKWREIQTADHEDQLKDGEAIMNFLTSDFPKGVFEPYFSIGLGTLWSVIYTSSSRGVYLAIGEGQGRKEIKLNLNNQNILENPVVLKTKLQNIELQGRLPDYKTS